MIPAQPMNLKPMAPIVAVLISVYATTVFVVLMVICSELVKRYRNRKK